MLVMYVEWPAKWERIHLIYAEWPAESGRVHVMNAALPAESRRVQATNAELPADDLVDAWVEGYELSEELAVPNAPHQS